MNRFFQISFFYFFVALTFAAREGLAAKGNFCEKGEERIFTCSLKGGKRLDLCGNQSKRALAYRFGKNGHVELTLPRDAGDSVSYNEIDNLSGGATYVRFKSKDFDYLVFSTTGQNGNFSGLRVKQKGKVISEKTCAEEADSLEESALKKLSLTKEGDGENPLL